MASFRDAELGGWSLAMTTGALIGGYGAAGFARKIGKKAVRTFVICIGLAIAVIMACKMFKP